MRVNWKIRVAILILLPAALGCWSLIVRQNQYVFTNVRALFFASLAASVVIGWTCAFRASAKVAVQRWATKQGYRVLRFQSPFLSGGFSWLTTSRGQVVYLVTIRDHAGHERKAWVRCGSFGGGALFSGQVEVKWQDDAGADLRSFFVATQAVSLGSMVIVSDQFRRTCAGGW